MRLRKIDKHSEINDIISRCQICHVAMVDTEGKPYLVPMNFGFVDDIIYLHSAQKGKKISEEDADMLIQYANNLIASL